jgi:hypothetical protein
MVWQKPAAGWISWLSSGDWRSCKMLLQSGCRKPYKIQTRFRIILARYTR